MLVDIASCFKLAEVLERSLCLLAASAQPPVDAAVSPGIACCSLLMLCMCHLLLCTELCLQAVFTLMLVDPPPFSG
jgi:hypothetical protein